MTQGAAPQHGRETAGRPAWLLPVALSAIVVIVAGVVVAIVTNRTGDSAAPVTPDPITTTVVLPVPTPTVTPVARQATSAFATALPTAVLQYALATSTADAEWVTAGALEAWSETYTDGGTGTLAVRSSQWETPAEATAFAAALVAALPTTAAPASPAPDAPALPASGEVLAAGTPVGTYTVVDGGDGTGIAVWSNGTAVFRLVAPLADVLDAYAQFPL